MLYCTRRLRDGYNWEEVTLKKKRIKVCHLKTIICCNLEVIMRSEHLLRDNHNSLGHLSNRAVHLTPALNFSSCTTIWEWYSTFPSLPKWMFNDGIINRYLFKWIRYIESSTKYNNSYKHKAVMTELVAMVPFHELVMKIGSHPILFKALVHKQPKPVP